MQPIEFAAAPQLASKPGEPFAREVPLHFVGYTMYTCTSGSNTPRRVDILVSHDDPQVLVGLVEWGGQYERVVGILYIVELKAHCHCNNIRFVHIVALGTSLIFKHAQDDIRD